MKKGIKGPILLVEDNLAQLENLKESLEERGYFIIPFHDGYGATTFINEGYDYKLGIVDLSLPDCDGEIVIKTSKKANPEVPVISSSGYYLGTVARLRLGSDQHIVKGLYHNEKLFEAIDSYFKDK